MTLDEFMDLDDRERDTAVAQGVFGNDVFSIGTDPCCGLQEAKHIGGGRHMTRNLARYSTDNADALSVIMKTRKRWEWSIESTDGGWNASATDRETERGPLAHCESLALAICIAALRASGMIVQPSATPPAPSENASDSGNIE